MADHRPNSNELLLQPNTTAATTTAKTDRQPPQPAMPSSSASDVFSVPVVPSPSFTRPPVPPLLFSSATTTSPQDVDSSSFSAASIRNVSPAGASLEQQHLDQSSSSSVQKLGIAPVGNDGAEGVRHRSGSAVIGTSRISDTAASGEGGRLRSSVNAEAPVESTSVPISSSHIERNQFPMGRRQRLAHEFTQQKMRAWQPVLTPRLVITSFMIFGIVFLGIGIGLLVSSNSVIECQVEYESPVSVMSPTTIYVDITKDHCVGINYDNPTISSTGIHMYYVLTNFYQNHRRYVNSLSPAQLAGTVFTSSGSLTACDPIIMADDGVRVRSPCGLSAWAVFNDTLSLYGRKDATNPSLSETNLRPIKMDEDGKTIAWYSDWKYKYRNPVLTNEQSKKVHLWLNEDIFPGQVENGHFMVWMRNAALPNFRKLYGKIEETKLELPVTVKIVNRYPVKSMQGTKSVVLSTASWYGGRNPFLGIFYLVIGSVCILLSALFTFRNRKSPRILGDIRHLHWTG
eukprot:GHVS01019901.1.p1 GENE.GHVS01019901.1~~GHVS01019901.1.p1  ORF type:complete len:514 (-),score=84.87 GHVS01019901.1:189-1730(-)